MNDPKQELVAYFLRRSEETLTDAKNLAGTNGWHSCLNRLYYACFYAVQAALNQKLTMEAKAHAGIKALFHLHFVKEGLLGKDLSTFYARLMQRREEGDYGVFENVEEDEVMLLLVRAEEFITTIKN